MVDIYMDISLFVIVTVGVKSIFFTLEEASTMKPVK